MKIYLIAIESNTGTDRVIEKLKKDMKNLSLDASLIFPQKIFENYLPSWLKNFYNNLPAKKLITYFFIEFYLLYLYFKNHRNNMIVVSFVYPLFGIGAVLNYLISGYKYFYWIPDMMYRKAYVKNIRWIFFIKLTNIGIRLCNKILVPSASAQLDVLTFCKPNITNKIFRLDGLIDHNYLNNLKSQPVESLIGKTFIFHPAGNKPSKNINLSLMAFNSLNNTEIKFVSLVNDVNSISNHNSDYINGHIKLKNISDAQMKWLYCNCQFASIVSIEEGIGLPILEANFFGKTIVTSIISAMPEVSNSTNVIQVNPFDEEDIARGYLSALNQPIELNNNFNASYGANIDKQILSLFK